MPYRCVIPHCKGNYKNGCKVHVFSFLKDKTLSDIWTCAIKSMDFSFIKFSRVMIMSFLLYMQEESNISIQSNLYELLNLMTQNKLDYSTEIIFSLLLYNCSPKGYRLLRDSKNIILPSYSTVKRLTLTTYMNPLIEQHDKNFLMYIKNKFKLLEQKDTTLS